MPADGRTRPRRLFRITKTAAKTVADVPGFPISTRKAAPVAFHPAVQTPRRRVGLALGGGAALGWAHIGIIRELAAQGVAIDVVAGTSIGAVVGACHAAGRLHALEGFARGLNRRRVFAMMDLSLGGSALIGGARLRRRLTRELGGLRIEDLALPFVAVATELGSGREVCIGSGDVVEAVRASYALPGIFEPLLIDRRWLFDGAMSNPVPVSVCRTLGADFVIAVNLTGSLPGGAPHDVTTDASLADLDAIASDVAEDDSDSHAPSRMKKARKLLFARRRLFKRRADGTPGIAGVVVGAFSIAQERISRARLAIDPPDVMLYARTPGVGLFEFYRAAEMIEHGRVVVRRAMPDIEARFAASERRR